MTNLPIEELENLEKKYNIMIHVITDVSRGVHDYYYKKRKIDDWIYVSDNMNELKDCLKKKFEG